MRSSGRRTYGTIFCAGNFVHAVKPAIAAEAAMYFKTFLRLSPAGFAGTRRVKSSSRNSRDSGVCARSAKSRHKRLPFDRTTRSRMAVKSSALLSKLSIFISNDVFPSSPVTRVATRQTLNLVFAHQLSPERELIRRRRVIHVEDLIAWPHIFLRLAMATEAPAHLQCGGPPCERHLAHAAVARGAADAFRDVDAVVEVRKFRQRVHASPGNRSARFVTAPHGLQHGTVRPDLRMAGHACLRRGHSRECRGLHRRVAVAAVNAKLPGMMAMAEGNGLRLRKILFRVIGRLSDLVERETEKSHNHGAAVDADARNRVRARMKYLRHKIGRA